MATKVFKEEQRFQLWEVYLLLLFFSLLTLFNLVREPFPIGKYGATDLFIFILLSLIIWYLYQLKMIVSFDDKGITVRYFPKLHKKCYIAWSDIADCRFVKLSKRAQWSGGAISFSTEERVFSLCGRNGLFLRTKKGEKYFIGSKKLLENKELVLEMINKEK